MGFGSGCELDESNKKQVELDVVVLVGLFDHHVEQH